MPFSLEQLPAVLVGAFVGALFATVVTWWRLRAKRRDIEKEALARSRATLRGQVSEQLAPHLPGFEFQASDARFLGSPIDYVVFDGVSDDEEVEVVLVEVKTGKARLSKGERRIQEAVEAGRVRFQTVRF